MDLDRYVTDLRRQLAASAGPGGEEVRALAETLSRALDPAARLTLLEALSDAAAEISRELAPGSVDIRLRGRDAELVVTRPPSPEFADAAAITAIDADTDSGGDSSGSGQESGGGADDTVTSRTTLRLPDQLKARVERAAASDGLSVNSWLVRAIAESLEPKNRRAAQRGSRSGDSFTGWVS